MNVVPIAIPSRSELWARVCLAQSVLSHRKASPDTVAVVLQVLAGTAITDLVSPAVPAKLVGDRLVVECCPWCSREHTHGAAYGYRVAHCGDGRGRGYYLQPSEGVACHG